MPRSAPGSIHEATTMTRRRMKSAGMRTFDARSMPPRTPWMMTQWVMPMKTATHRRGFQGLEEKSEK